jgi:hypothetical protein
MQVYKNKNYNHPLKKIKRKKPKIFKVSLILYFNMVWMMMSLSNALNVSIHHRLVVVIAQGCATTTRNKFFSLVFVFHYIKSLHLTHKKACSIFWLEINTTNQQIKASKVTNKQTNKQISPHARCRAFWRWHYLAPCCTFPTPKNSN